MVGHSMGGIILRACLRHLNTKILEMLHTFISFASPHLGFLHCQSFITQAGIKLFDSLYSSLSLKQISNRDHPMLKDTFIYELSKSGPLTHFKHILLFSSIEDKYVPWNSARIQLNKRALGISGAPIKNQKHSIRRMEEKMMGNILGLPSPQFKGKAKSLHRFEVDFNTGSHGIDTIIGRAAHVAFLINRHVIPMALLGCL